MAFFFLNRNRTKYFQKVRKNSNSEHVANIFGEFMKYFLEKFIKKNKAAGEILRIFMEALVDYIKPELLITAIALYFMGIALKEAQAVKDKYIPLILGCAGILICGIYVFATCSCKNAQDIAMAVFTSTTQGVLVAGLSTYVNQLIKQLEKDE